MQTGQNIRSSMNGDASRKIADDAHEVMTDVAHGAAKAVIGLKENIMDRYEKMEDQAHALAERSAGVVKRYPLYSVLGAVTIGLLAGMLVARRS